MGIVQIVEHSSLSATKNLGEPGVNERPFYNGYRGSEVQPLKMRKSQNRKAPKKLVLDYEECHPYFFISEVHNA